ncbi:hypothetical protein SDC9_204541 [bioreactor metagenome]|uniref:Uncharacterized protein n=1 Tax=bioreactor metagenome TaxID=1076179 RepID=A0A645IZJ7_9ZZZZ
MYRTEVIIKTGGNQIAVGTYLRRNPSFGLVVFRIIVTGKHFGIEYGIVEGLLTDDDRSKVLIFEREPFKRFGEFLMIVLCLTHFLYILLVVFIVDAGETIFEHTSLLLLADFLLPIHTEIGKTFGMKAIFHTGQPHLKIHHVFIGRKGVYKIDIMTRTLLQAHSN